MLAMWPRIQNTEKVQNRRDPWVHLIFVIRFDSGLQFCELLNLKHGVVVDLANLLSNWATFLQKAIPPGIPPGQKHNCRNNY